MQRAKLVLQENSASSVVVCGNRVHIVSTRLGEHRIDLTVMDRRMLSEDYYSPQFQQQRQTVSRPGVFSYWKALDGEHLLLCLLSAIAVYAVGYIVAWLFFSGIMFFLSVGLVVFLVMEIADSVDSSVGETK